VTAAVTALPLSAVRRALHEAAGATWASVPAGADASLPVPRSYGDPAAEYRAAREAAVVIDRVDRGLLRVFGRDPVRMIHGLVSNDVASLEPGGSVYATMLTAKGRLVADLRVIRRDTDLLLEADVGALPGVRRHLSRFVPPLFARVEDAGDAFAVLGLYGPGAPALLSSAQNAAAGLLAIGADPIGVPGHDLIVPAPMLAGVWAALGAAGARPAGHAALDVLRIEAGVPRWGAELDEDVIPLEAGLGERAISTTKGCYTGQEVIIRILHRGHVNRHLRGLLLGEHPAPSRGAALFRAGSDRPVGHVTSSCLSPRLEQTVALAYIRREVEPGEAVRLGDPAGAEARVVTLPFPDTAGP
jgi:folate-binding protein YgfZ